MRGLLAGTLAALVWAAPAAGQGTTVATDGDATLRASARSGGEVCLALRTARSGAQACGMAPALAAQAVLLPGFSREAGGGPLALAAPAGVVTAEVVRRDGSTTRLDLRAAPAGAPRALARLRFGVLAEAGEEPLRRVRLLAADGTPAGSVAPRGDLPTGPREVVARQAGVRLVAFAAVRPAPSVLDDEREQPVACVATETGQGSSERCVTDEEAPTAGVSSTLDCPARRGQVVSGVADPGTREVVAVLGSGRRVRGALANLPASTGVAARAWVVVAPRGEAVRSVQVRGEGRPRTHDLGLPPATAACFRRSGFGSGTGFAFDVLEPGRGGAQGPGTEVARAGGVPLLAAEGRGDELCLGLGTLGARAVCGLVAPDPSSFAPQPVLERGGRSFTGIVVPATIARADVVSRGRTTAVALQDAPAALGRFAGRVRFAVVPLPRGGGGRPALLRLRTAEGLTAARLPLALHTPSALPRPRPLGRLAGRAARAFGAGCITLGAVRAGLPACVFGLELQVACDLRRVLLVGTVPRKVRRVALDLAGGRRVTGRVVRVGSRSAALAAAPRGARVTGVRLDGRRRAVALPSPAAQCGYALEVPLG